jgi:superfamily II DNA helicase RecQ
MDTAAQVQRMMGKAAEFRGVQKEAIDAIVDGKSPVVAVMPTRAGKSLLFMLPAWAEQGGTTVVVVPLITLPPSEEDELFRRMYVERDQVALFWAETARTNVAYQVVRIDKTAKKNEVEEIVLSIVRQKLRKHKTGKVVVYGNSVPKVKELANQLGCNAYYHRAVGKASMLQAFAAGNKRVIVATSALGMGVDIPDI